MTFNDIYSIDVVLYNILIYLSYFDLLRLIKVNKYSSHKIKTINLIWKDKLIKEFNERIESNYFDMYQFCYKNLVLPENYKFFLNIKIKDTNYNRQIIYYKNNNNIILCALRDTDYQLKYNCLYEDTQNINLKITLFINKKNIYKKIYEINKKIEVINLIDSKQEYFTYESNNISYSMKLNTKKSTNMYENDFIQLEILFPSITLSYETLCGLILESVM